MSAPPFLAQTPVEEANSEIGVPPAPPSLTGPAPALWAGFAAFVAVFVLVLLLIIRGRVLRPAARKAAAPTDFFEPAGQSAEITFDDDAPPGGLAGAHEDAHAHAGAGAENVPENGAEESAEEDEAAASPPAAHRQAGKSRGSPFAGLFAKKPKAADRQPGGEDMAALEEDAPADKPADKTAPSDRAENALTEKPRAETPRTDDGRPAQPNIRLKTLDDEVEARRREAEARELRRLEAREEAEEKARRRGPSAAAALAAFPKPPGRPAPADMQQFDRMRRALEDGFAERLDQLKRDLDQRLTGLAEQIDRQAPPPAEPALDPAAAISEAHFAELANLIGEQLETLRETSTTSIDALTRRLDKLETAPEGVAALSKNVAQLNRTLGGRMSATTAGRLQLTDILANALPPGRYALARRLSNGRTVDALVQLADGAPPVPIDARFPVEAFDAYERSRLENGQSETTETEFRRLMLRRIVDIAEKQIAADETADCALMFAPSEHILTTLYASFADIVQESYRARIWITSPASLTASLYTISALTGGSAFDISGTDDDEARHDDAGHDENGYLDNGHDDAGGDEAGDDDSAQLRNGAGAGPRAPAGSEPEAPHGAAHEDDARAPDAPPAPPQTGTPPFPLR